MTNKPRKTANVGKSVDKLIFGIDEAGRGPLAGPLSVGVFCILGTLNVPRARNIFRSVKESKQLSEAQREAWFSKIESARAAGLVDFSVQFQTAQKIDSRGLTRAINEALSSGLKKVLAKNKINPEKCLILLDGGLRAPAHFKNQKTIIRGDEKKMVIALASICAKVLRDRRMRGFAKKYPHYGFEIHKGYGTRAHYAAIRKHGLTPIHRRSFLRKIL